MCTQAELTTCKKRSFIW